MFLLILDAPKPNSSCNVNLHSTMFLLILSFCNSAIFFSVTFTFHNVSIDSDVGAYEKNFEKHLHSTMFLLILVTFAVPTESPKEFTFHNVSIDSLNPAKVAYYDGRIYIPQCFY